MEEQVQPEKSSGSAPFVSVRDMPVALPALGVLVGVMVVRYVIGLQPVPPVIFLVGGIVGGVFSTV